MTASGSGQGSINSMNPSTKDVETELSLVKKALSVYGISGGARREKSSE